MTLFPWKITRSGQELYFPEGARRFLSVSVEQIGGDGRVDRAIDGSAIYLGDPAFRRHAVTLSCSGHTVAPVFDLWPGQLVALECPVEFAVPGPVATLAYDPVAGSVYGVDEDDRRLPGLAVVGRSVTCPNAVALRYRPVMQCIVASRTSDKTQGKADAGWTIRLEDLSGAEIDDDEGASVSFAAPGLQSSGVGELFLLALAGLVTTNTGLPVSFSVVSGALPAGLSVSGAGVVSGTPTAYGVSVAVVRATSGLVSATQTVPFFSAAPTLRASGVALQNYTVGTAYSFSFAGNIFPTGSAEYPTAALNSGSLPPGLSISGLGISGTPTAAGAYASTIRVSWSTGQFVDLTIAFFAAASGGSSADTNPFALATGGQQTLNFTESGNNLRALRFTASGNLVVTQGGWADVEAHGGGGGGGHGQYGGGGGAGAGVRRRVYLLAGTYPIIVGAGGPGGSSASVDGGDGSAASGLGIVASGGGGGSSRRASGTSNGRPGASGGGVALGPATGGAATAPSIMSSGNAGGGAPAATSGGAGGGGAGGAGTPPNKSYTNVLLGGDGGAGETTTFDGTNRTVGGGGAGGGLTEAGQGVGGSGVGGNGGTFSIATNSMALSPQPGAANSGSGGGGAGHIGPGAAGAAGYFTIRFRT